MSYIDVPVLFKGYLTPGFYVFGGPQASFLVSNKVRVQAGALGFNAFSTDFDGDPDRLWATRDEPCWHSVAWLADRGVLVAPGTFYGPEGQRHVRVAITATDERVAAAAERLAA